MADIKDEMGRGTRLRCMSCDDGDMLLVMESGDFKQRLVVEVTRSPMRRPKVHAALRLLAEAIEEEGG